MGSVKLMAKMDEWDTGRLTRKGTWPEQTPWGGKEWSMPGKLGVARLACNLGGFPVTHIFNDPVKVLRTRGRVQTREAVQRATGATKVSEQDSDVC